MIEESPPTAEAGAWQAVTTLRLYAADRVWVVAFALQRRAAAGRRQGITHLDPTANHRRVQGPGSCSPRPSRPLVPGRGCALPRCIGAVAARRLRPAAC